MKKVTALLTAMTMVLSLSACGSEPAESSNEMSSAAQESQTEKKETTPEESEASDSSEESQPTHCYVAEDFETGERF